MYFFFHLRTPVKGHNRKIDFSFKIFMFTLQIRIVKNGENWMDE